MPWPSSIPWPFCLLAYTQFSKYFLSSCFCLALALSFYSGEGGVRVEHELSEAEPGARTQLSTQGQRLPCQSQNGTGERAPSKADDENNDKDYGRRYSPTDSLALPYE